MSESAMIDQDSLVAAVEQAADSIVITDLQGRIQYVNPAFTRITGYTSAEAVGQNPRILRSGDQSVEFYRAMWETIVSGQGWHGELVNRRKDGTLYQEEMQITPVRNSAGEISRYIAIKHDVTERRAREDEKAFLAAIVESSPDAIIASTAEGIIRSWNRGAEALLGFTREEMIGQHVFAFVPAGRESLMAGWVRKVVGGEVISQYEGLCLHRDGRNIDVLATATAIKDSEGKVTTLVAVMHDITKRKQSEELLLFKTALLEGQTEATLDGILAVDESNRVILANKQFGAIFGIPEDLLKTGDNALVLGFVRGCVEDPVAFDNKIMDMRAHQVEKWRDELKLKNGMTVDRYIAPLMDSRGKHRGRIIYFRDISDRKQAEDRSQFLAFHDALTGLPHRALLQDRLHTALSGARRRHEKVALLFVDLDRFKNINDTYGHSYGDDVLKEVARRLTKWSREQDTVARLGGDEFLIMLNGVKDAADVAIAAARLLDAMSAKFLVQGNMLSVGCSVGISLFPEHGADGETLIKNADEALYCAKDTGRGNVRFFTSQMNLQATERLSLEKNLRVALDRSEFFLVYQPQMSLANGAVTGFEALIRWRQPELGLIMPARFISLAENSGLILPIGEWVLRTACTEARRWQDAGRVSTPVAVNVSAVQFRQEGFVPMIRRVLSETGLEARFLELEITEGLLLSEVDLTFSVLHELDEMGVRLTIDDFGTGYSSLSYLKHFPVSRLKIDRSFVRDITTDPDDAAIVAAIIAMARSLKLNVIAEGVENEMQLSFLRGQGCDECQGYHLGKPMTAEEVHKWQGFSGALVGLGAALRAIPLSTDFNSQVVL